MTPDLREHHLGMLRELMKGAKRDRLAMDAVLGVVAGDSLDEAIERLEKVQESIPPRRDGRQGRNRLFNSLVADSKEIVEQTVHDLRRVRDLGAARP